MTIRSKKRVKISVLTGMIATSLVVTSVSTSDSVKASFEGFKPKCQTSTTASATTSGSSNNDEESTADSSSNSAPASDDDWMKKGTKSNQIAQNMWNYWKGKGFGGPAISGVMGNVAHEGGFDIPDRAEGHYGGDEKSNGISEGIVPVVSGSQYPVGKTGQQEGGAGHYQFTPYSKFAAVGDKKWKSTEAQSDYVWTSEVQKAKWLKSYIALTSVEEAVTIWFSKYERGASLNPAKITSGKKAYTIFGGANVSADSALANAVSTAQAAEDKQEEKKASTSTSSGCPAVSTGNTDKAGDGAKGVAGATDAKLVEEAVKLLGYFHYVQVHAEHYIGSIENPIKTGITDCSGYVWLVLARCGYKVPNEMAWYTGTMTADARGKHEWLQEIPAKDAKAGDIVIVNSPGEGHTAFLMEDWKSGSDQQNTTKIIQMGGSSKDGVNESKFSTAFGSILTGEYTLTLARPIKK
ncbi:hypothetical protein HCA73_16245 [Listeria booriae]|nr:hypothetical protein [Listeria booriae]